MEGWATIIAALLGAGIGSLGAQILGEQSRKQQLIEATKRDVAVHHLMQLQDALESLWFRFVNPEVDEAQRQAEDQVGDQKVDEAADEYYEQSSLFVLANALAQIRLLVVEGAYAALDVFDDDLRKARPETLERKVGPPGQERPRRSIRLLGMNVSWGGTETRGLFPWELERALDAVEKIIGKELEGVSFYRYQRRALADLMLSWESSWRVLSYPEFMKTVETSAYGRPAKAFLVRLVQERKHPESQKGSREKQIADEVLNALDIVGIGTGVELPVPIAKAIKAKGAATKDEVPAGSAMA